MPWLTMTIQEAESFDADMLARVAAIRGSATRYSWPEETTEKGTYAVLVATEHASRLDPAKRTALQAAKPGVREIEARIPERMT